MKGQLGGLMQQAQKMQEQMQKQQEELANKVITGQAGAGIVKVTMNGKSQLKSLDIDYDMLDGDMEMMEDLIIAAFNDAQNKITSAQQGSMADMMGGMQLPPDFKMPF
ncbi:Nucleoid-associated protein YaaK [hydrothermal vent metagenome]|uniref:Nucleoid-associated protein YaaK n=1 Tax=hydrothermal vent metagenome TaxID=652676 RepID=A0A3B0VFM3_9ZZZZ